MEHVKTQLRSVIAVNRMVTIRYYEYTNSFVFPGEFHDFWEFVCVDKGEVIAQAEDQCFLLKKNQVIFHKPNEFHAIRTEGKRGPNLFVLSFECRSPAMSFFENRILTVDAVAKQLLSAIINEARSAFPDSIFSPSVAPLQRAKNAAFGAEEMIRLYLEHLLIHWIRTGTSDETAQESQRVAGCLLAEQNGSCIDALEKYLEIHIRDPLNMDQICRDFAIGRSRLQELAHKEWGCGIIHYFNRRKINLAKEMIRDGEKNFTEIADELAFSSLAGFSRKFKELSGMSPSEYFSSVMKLTDQAAKLTPRRGATAGDRPARQQKNRDAGRDGA